MSNPLDRRIRRRMGMSARQQRREKRAARRGLVYKPKVKKGRVHRG